MPRLSLLPAMFASLFLLLPATAHAEGPAAAPRQATDDTDPSISLRFDFLGGVMAGAASNARVSAFAVVPALKLDLGVQLGDHAALYGRVEGGTLLLMSEGAAYFVGEWSPTPLFSVGTGIGYEGMSFAWGGGCDSTGSCIQNSWSGVSVPLLLAIDLRSGRPTTGRDAGFRFELEGAAGYDARTETWGGHGFVGVGGTWR